MSDVAIRAEGLSKWYRIGAIRPRSRRFGDVLSQAVTAPYRRLKERLKGEANKSADSIWALKDMNFEIKHGEVVGIIGRNGAGKSTLLKVISRITDPTNGFVDIHGRVGSLLEVGTGFHFDLSGRDNIYLNGSILGMRKTEIDRKLEEIVEFAGVGKFLDTPVKNYSSGMYLRLAFSVAAHLEPEILVVDEVLSVGDLEFQKKCLGKMEDVASHGRTVLFVSHNLAAVKQLCQTSLVLDGGRIAYRGSVVEGIIRYGEQTMGRDNQETVIGGTGWRSVLIKVEGGSNGTVPTLNSGEPFIAEAALDLREDYIDGRIIFLVENSAGVDMIHSGLSARQLISTPLHAGRYKFELSIPPLWLAPGIYSAYFKFIGFRSTGESSPFSGEDRRTSERINIDVVGDVTGTSDAQLTPPVQWEMVPVSTRPVTSLMVSDLR